MHSPAGMVQKCDKIGVADHKYDNFEVAIDLNLPSSGLDYDEV